MGAIGDFIDSSRRIFTVSRKPTWEEYRVMLQVTGVGIIVIGVVGYAIALVFKGLSLGV